MSKSLGNFFTARDLVEGRGADPLALRYALISQNYRVPHNFTMDLLRDATNKVERYKLCDSTVQAAIQAARPGDDAIGESLEELYQATLDAMLEDLNTSVALAKALEGTRVILREGEGLNAKSAASGKLFLDRVNGLLGIVRYDGTEGETSAVRTQTGPQLDTALIESLIGDRSAAKKEKDFAKADAIRKQLEELGVELRDSPEGTSWKPKGPTL
jgi:cysteinyl-tRNA synthetase